MKIQYIKNENYLLGMVYKLKKNIWVAGLERKQQKMIRKQLADGEQHSVVHFFLMFPWNWEMQDLCWETFIRNGKGA